jgi:hypothetical protein
MLGRERPEDLMILCRPCHDRVHGPGFYSTGMLKLIFWVVVLSCLLALAVHLMQPA